MHACMHVCMYVCMHACNVCVFMYVRSYEMYVSKYVCTVVDALKKVHNLGEAPCVFLFVSAGQYNLLT